MKRVIVLVLVMLLCFGALADTGSSIVLTKRKADESIKEVQNRLIELGYLNKKSNHGKYDSKTQNAVKHFQSWNLLTVTGELDDETRAKILSDSAFPFPSTFDMSPQDFIGKVSEYRQIVGLSAIHHTIDDNEHYSRALNISIDGYTSMVLTQCGGKVVEFMMIGVGDGTQTSGATIMMTFSGAIAASDSNIDNNQAFDYMMQLMERDTMTLNGIKYTYSRNAITGNLLTGSLVD